MLTIFAVSIRQVNKSNIVLAFINAFFEKLANEVLRVIH